MSTHNVEDVYGLSPLQFGMLFHSLEDTSDTRPYMVQMTEQIDGPFDEDCFRGAWQDLVDRHTILRSAFIWEGVSEPLQVVQRTAQVPFAVRDWRGLTDGEREECLRRFLAADWDQGFDLARAPLVRVTLLRTQETQWIAVWSFHHILIDGWSVQILQSELDTRYRSRLAGRAPVPQPPPIPFRRYIEWLGAQQPAEAEQFWTRYLAGLAGATELGIERAVREAGGAGGLGTASDHGIGEVEFVAAEALSTRARDYARRQRITLNTLVQGVWSLLLSRYSGSDDVVFGSTVSGRSADLPGVDTMMGLFINTLPVRVRLDATARIGDWLRQVQDEQLDLRQWEHSHLVDVHEYSNVPRGEPLFRSILVFENYPVMPESEGDDLPDGMTSKLLGCVERTGYPLTLVVSAGHDFEFRLVYDRSIYADDAMRRLVVHLRTLLAAVIDGDDAALVADPGMVSGEELASVVSGWNRTEGWFPDGATIHGLIRDRVSLSTDDVAVVCGEQSLTFGEVWGRAESLARYLVSTGVGPGSLVGVCLDRGPELVCALVGVMLAGAAFVPVDPEYPLDRIGFILEDTAAPVVITQGSYADRLPESASVLLVDGTWPSGDADLPEVAATELAYVIYTSGSTGRPKGVLLEHRGVVNYLHWCDVNYPPVGPNGVGSLLYSSVSFDLTITALFLPLMQGQRLVIPVPAEGGTVFDAAVEFVATGEPIGFFKATPSHLEVLAGHLESMGAQHAINAIVAGGEDLTPTLVAKILGTSSVKTVVSNEYGATECSVANVMSLTTAPEQGSHTTSVGLPITNTTAYVVDRLDRPVPVGVVGECLLGGVAVARGYLNRPELTAARFVDLDLGDGVVRRVYRTGDLVKRRANGELEFVGRIDDQVKVRGYRIELGEIESQLQAHPLVGAAAVIVRQDTPGDKRLVGYFVPLDGIAAPSTEDLRTFLSLTLPEYMVPSVMVPLDVLPLTPNGKVDRKALPAPDPRERGTGNTYVAPRTEMEHTLAAIWSEILGVTPVGIHDNFFQLGGHSITAVRVCSRISAAGHDVRLQQIMRHSTVAALAAAISGPADVPNSLVVRLSTPPSTTSSPATPTPRLFCVHPGGGSTHSYRALADRLAGVFDLYGIQALGLNPGETPIDSVPEMAERYWREIRAVQPEGPYLLFGWSTGAVVAHAMGALNPDEVAQAYLLEPAVTGPARGPAFEHYAGVYRRVSQLWELGRRETGARRAAVEAELRRLAPEMNIDVDSVTLDQWLPYDVLGAEVRALAAYEPAPSRVGATLFVSATVRDGSGDEVAHADYLTHWDRLYPAGLDVLDLPGAHMQMVKGTAQLDALAEVLAAHRDRRPALT